MKYKAHPFRSSADLGQYQREFHAVARPLLWIGLISEQEMSTAFVSVFSGEAIRLLHRRLSQSHPSRPAFEPHKQQDVVQAAWFAIDHAPRPRAPSSPPPSSPQFSPANTAFPSQRTARACYLAAPSPEPPPAAPTSPENHPHRTERAIQDDAHAADDTPSPAGSTLAPAPVPTLDPRPHLCSSQTTSPDPQQPLRIEQSPLTAENIAHSTPRTPDATPEPHPCPPAKLDEHAHHTAQPATPADSEQQESRARVGTFAESSEAGSFGRGEIDTVSSPSLTAEHPPHSTITMPHASCTPEHPFLAHPNPEQDAPATRSTPDRHSLITPKPLPPVNVPQPPAQHTSPVEQLEAIEHDSTPAPSSSVLHLVQPPESPAVAHVFGPVPSTHEPLEHTHSDPRNGRQDPHSTTTGLSLISPSDHPVQTPVGTTHETRTAPDDRPLPPSITLSSSNGLPERLPP